MPTDQKRKELQRMKLGHPPYSYQPARRSQLEILNVDAGPLGIVPRAPYQQIADEIIKRSKSEAEIVANLAFASALYDYADGERLKGRRQDFFPLAIGTSAKVSFWLPAVIAIDGRPTVLFIDPRRTKKLTEIGRQFAFSLMHERIRAADPDFAEVELAIMQFGVDGDDTRKRVPKVHTASGIPLFDFDTLDAMVRETYDLWHEVLTEREADARRRGTGTGTGGGLF
jgi:hypothetical protein